MAKTITLSSIRTTIRQRCDMENSEFISDLELTSYINASYAELYDILVSRFEDYYTSTSDHTVASGSSSFAVPSDFYKIRGVDRQIGTDFYALRKFNFAQRNHKNRRLNSQYQLDVQYRLVGNNIELIPTDQADGTYKLWYVPVYTTLTADGDTIDGVNGFEEYIIVDCCIKALEKEESDTSTFERQKKALMTRIEQMASNRDIDQPDSITDVYENMDDDINIW